MLDRSQQQLLKTTLRALNVSSHKIAQILDLVEDRAPQKDQNTVAILLNQAAAARLISGSRFLVRRLVKDGKIRQIFLTADCVRYARADLEKLASDV